MLPSMALIPPEAGAICTLCFSGEICLLMMGAGPNQLSIDEDLRN